ncbi:hypothetical protein Tco_1336223 [Tanacetum coccineum]
MKMKNLAGSNRGFKKRRARKEPESACATKGETSKSTGKSKEGSKSHQTSTGKSAQAEEPIHADKRLGRTHIRSLIQDLLKINMLMRPLGFLIGFRNQQNLQLPTVIDRLCCCYGPESARDVYSRNRIIGIKKLTIVGWHNYKHLEWITVHKKNILMRIDELHKFSDGTLNDVRSALDDTLKKIRMKYLPQTIWRVVDRERAGAMIQAID